MGWKRAAAVVKAFSMSRGGKHAGGSQDRIRVVNAPAADRSDGFGADVGSVVWLIGGCGGATCIPCGGVGRERRGHQENGTPPQMPKDDRRRKHLQGWSLGRVNAAGKAKQKW